MSPTTALLCAVCLAVCVYSLPVEPKFRQMALQAQQAETTAEIQAISTRIAFLQKLNKLTYDTTLFTRKLRWLLRRSLTEKPSVADVAELMKKELEISKAQIEVAVEGVADELKLEVKQGIIALKAGLAFIEDNYVAGSDPEADAIIARIKENLKHLEERFGRKFGETVEPAPEVSSTGPEPTPAVSSTAPEPTPEPSSTAEPTPEPSSTAEPTPEPVVSSTVAEPPAAVSSSTAPGSIIEEPSASSTVAEAPVVSSTVAEAPVVSSTAEATPAASSAPIGEQPVASSTAEAPLPPSVTFESSSSSTGLNNSNETSSSTGDFGSLAEQPLAEQPVAPTPAVETGAAFFF